MVAEGGNGLAAEVSPVVLEDSPLEHQDPAEVAAAQREAASQAEQMESYARAAYNAMQIAEQTGAYGALAQASQNYAQLSANASVLRTASTHPSASYARSAVALYGAGGLAAAAVATMRVENNEAIMEAIEGNAAEAAALGKADGYYSVAQFTERASLAQGGMREYLIRSGMYTESTETYLNSTTEAQWRTFEQELLVRYPGMDKALLHDTKSAQLNYEALEAQAKFEEQHPERATEMKELYAPKSGKTGVLELAARNDVPNEKLRASLAVIDANKFMDLEERVREKKANGETLNAEEQRALTFLNSEEYKNLTPEQKRHIQESAKVLEQNKVAASEANKELLAQHQHETKALEEEMAARGASKEEIKEAVQDKIKEYQHGFETRSLKFKERNKERELGETVRRIEEGQDVAPSAVAAVEGQDALATASREYNCWDFARILAGNSEISKLLASMGVTGGAEVPNTDGMNLAAGAARNPEQIAQMHKQANEAQGLA